MERNWLIRTTQNQILGPVAKAKLLEFLKKGALGLNDEVCSGNGYWFALKEKDLVEKYLHGDLPQGYNPISESKSILSRRDNPDKTTSINTAPANATQVIKLSDLQKQSVPKSEDLEFPDITLLKPASASTVAVDESVKLPNPDDLEFPDITLVSSQVQDTLVNVSHGSSAPKVEARPVEIKQRATISSSLPESQTEDTIVYPADDDLAFPDLSAIEDDRDFKVELPNKDQPPAAASAQAAVSKQKRQDFKNEFEDGSGLSLAKEEPAPHVREEVKPERPQPKRERPVEEKKLLHERKVKAQPAPEKPPRPEVQRQMPEHLKKRNDNYLMYVLVILILIILSLFFYYYRTILNKPLPV